MIVPEPVQSDSAKIVSPSPLILSRIDSAALRNDGAFTCAVPIGSRFIIGATTSTGANQWPLAHGRAPSNHRALGLSHSNPVEGLHKPRLGGDHGRHHIRWKRFVVL